MCVCVNELVYYLPKFQMIAGLGLRFEIIQYVQQFHIAAIILYYTSIPKQSDLV